jgi:hypothetical protein
MCFCQLLQGSYTLEIHTDVNIGFKQEIISPFIVQRFKLIGCIGIKYPELGMDLWFDKESFLLTYWYVITEMEGIIELKAICDFVIV